MIDVADSAHGIWTQPLQALNWSGDRGASLAPKSTVRLVTAVIPAPEPTPLYWRLIPYADPTGLIHCETRGCTKVLPAPLIVSALLRAEAPPAVAATNAAATTARSPASTAVRRRAPRKDELPSFVI